MSDFSNPEFSIPQPLSPIHVQIMELSPRATVEKAAEVIDRVAFYMTAMKWLKDLCEQQIIEWVEVNGDLVIGDIRYYVGNKKTTKCKELPKAVEAILSACNGDFDSFCQILSANAIKPGAARALLPPEVFEELFTTTEQVELREGKPTKKLQRIDTKFLKGNGNGEE